MARRVLILELNNYHDEVLPTWCRAFRELGFRVDVLTSRANWKKNVFALTEKPDSLRWQRLFRVFLKKGLAFLLRWRYTVIVFNSVEPAEFLRFAGRFGKRCIGVLHNAALVTRDPEYSRTLREGPTVLWSLADFVSERYLGGTQHTLFPYHLSDRSVSPGDTLTFCVQGHFEYGRRNYDSLLQALRRLKDDGVSGFRVAFIGKVKPHDFERFRAAAESLEVMEFLQFFSSGLAYGEFFSQIAQCHYLLPLLEPGIPAHEGYYKDSATSSISMAVGLSVIPVMERKLAELYGLTEIALTYSLDETLYQAMSVAIGLSEADRRDRVARLAAFRGQRLKQNTENLRAFLDSVTVAKTAVSR